MLNYSFNIEEDRILEFDSRMHKAHKTNPDFRLEGQSTPRSPTLTEEEEKQRGGTQFIRCFICLVCCREKCT